MASDEHKDLATFIKSVHKELRQDVEKSEGSLESVWERHLGRTETLRTYAEAMKTLATQHWTDNSNSRILWLYRHIDQYYFNGGLQSEHIRDEKFAKRHGEILADFQPPSVERPRVLDVGSCYNPFSVFDKLDVTAIDIAPASLSVRKADFLNIDITDEHQSNEEEGMRLRKDSFHVVIFCLLLEYLPSASQRLKCIRNAISILKEDGLLCIITPDSSHMGKNVEQMKAWRKGLSLLGLRKMVYEKTKHFHGLIFRKPSLPLQSLTMARAREEDDNQSSIERLFYIPQDITASEHREESDQYQITQEDREYFKETFLELPSF